MHAGTYFSHCSSTLVACWFCEPNFERAQTNLARINLQERNTLPLQQLCGMESQLVAAVRSKTKLLLAERDESHGFAVRTGWHASCQTHLHSQYFNRCSTSNELLLMLVLYH